jgi:uncharacterized repeat protein (TIGR03803 family)
MSKVTLFCICVGIGALCIQPVHAQNLDVLHYFSGGADGATPFSGLTTDAQGNFYGTTFWGGSSASCSEFGFGCGTVYQLKRTDHGWVFNTLYEFTGGSGGANPYGKVVFGPDGALYGTTWEGGAQCPNNPNYGCGTVFRLRPSSGFCGSSCPWVETVIHRFAGSPTDGALPYAGLTFDKAGNIYGTTYSGGITSANCYYQGQQDYCGTVFELSPHVDGNWSESLLYMFSGGGDGSLPASGLTIDAAGNLYGTTVFSGAYNQGTVYELSPGPSGWTQRTLYSLNCGRTGCYPLGDVVFDGPNAIYGTTQAGGSGGGGTVFQITQTNGVWGLAKVYGLIGSNGSGPHAGVTIDAAGNLYGTTYSTGPNQLGQVFMLTPSPCCFSYTLVHQFSGDGAAPISTVTVDAQGNLYGTTTSSYPPYWGAVWELTPQ